MSKLGMSQSRDLRNLYLRNLMDDVGHWSGNLVPDIKKLIQSERKLRLVFDNFEFKILDNIILQNHRNCTGLDSSPPSIGYNLTILMIPAPLLLTSTPSLKTRNIFLPMKNLTR